MVSVRQAKTPEDYGTARRLIAIMAEWDATETRARGFPADNLLEQNYSQTPEQLMAKFSSPGAAMLIAWVDSEPAGCAGFSNSGNNAAEIHKMFVRPEFRGRGAARALMAAVLSGMKENGFAEARLETVDFMTEAIALYRSFGFEPCDPIHEVLEELKDITVFFRRAV